MALTYTNIRQEFLRNKRTVEADVTFDNNYPTGGEVVTLSELGLTRVERVDQLLGAPDERGVTTDALDTTGVSVGVDLTDLYAPQLLLYTGAATEAGNTSDQSAVIVRLRFIGA